MKWVLKGLEIRRCPLTCSDSGAWLTVWHCSSDAHSPRVWKLIEEQYECHDFLGGFEVSGLLTRDCYNGVMVYTRKDEQVASAADA